MRQAGSGVGRIGDALHDAQIDPNPHQIDAARFAFISPLQNGVILADEVGLGKTIEAGLVMLQRWSEGARRVLVVCPSSLRKQWSQELADKFFLPSLILEGGTWKQFEKQGHRNPFEQADVVICSYHFAAARSDTLAMVAWDLVVMDEAHRVRNVYKKDNKIGRSLREALRGRRKLLLTATPLQNSLMELFGLVSFVDEHAFGDERSYRLRFGGAADMNDARFEELRQRLRPICHRTLRRQVTEYVSYTQRIPITKQFVPRDEEQTLYDLVTEYLQRPSLNALPSGQRTLLTLVLRKLLASSSFAIAGALDTLVRRLNGQLKDDAAIRAALSEDYEELTETEEEWSEAAEPMTDSELKSLEAEIAELAALRELAVGITENAKGQALLESLRTGFEKASELGASEKAIIFTESRRTQDYLVRLLGAHGYADDIVLFNGSNTDPASRAIYADWLARHQGTDAVSGSRTADIRAALVDAFRSSARIMIATEAAAEGINLQFCSLLVNYDLPWNPQRVEQRIGRCHRYGQKYDVVVINFVNAKNAADVRVFELLDKKFHLFSGVFGASDEVLGAVESGVDFEQRLIEIYRQCRTKEEIGRQFDQLQLDLEQSINAAMQKTRQHLLEHFDAEVHERLRLNVTESANYLSALEQDLWQLSKNMLADYASFDDKAHRFNLQRLPIGLDASEDPSLLGSYQMQRYPQDARKYRLGHPVAQWVLRQARGQVTPDTSIRIDYDAYRDGGGAKRSRLENLRGHQGWLQLDRLDLESLDAREQFLLLVAIDDDGSALEQGTAVDLLRVTHEPAAVTDAGVPELLSASVVQAAQTQLGEVKARNQAYFGEAMDKLDGRATDLKNGLEHAIKELDREIRELRRQARAAADLEAKLELHQQINVLERKRNAQRRDLFAQQDAIDQDKERLIDEVQGRLDFRIEQSCLFRLRWSIASATV